MSDSEEKRRTLVREAVANERLEGLQVSDESQSIAANYVVGKVDAAEAARQIRVRYGVQ